MLKELHVKNFAIIDDVKIQFGDGLSILSGETGAGKTLIIEAINLLIGERADSGLIREGKNKLLVQGFFDFRDNGPVKDYLLNNNILDKDDFINDVVIARELNRTGKNKAFINGLFIQISSLKDLGSRFLDIHGQHDHQYLLDAKTHINIVDNSAKSTTYPLKKKYLQKYKEFLSHKKKLADLKIMQKNRDGRLQNLMFRYEEISRMKIQKGEDVKLKNELSILKNFESIYRIASETEVLIKGNSSEKSDLSESISIINANMEKLAVIDNRFKDLSERMGAMLDLLEEVKHFVVNYLTDFDFSRERLDTIQERLYSFSMIKKKYNIDISKTQQYLDKIKVEIDTFESIEDDIETCETKLKISADALLKVAKQLRFEREIASRYLEEKNLDELGDLGFKTVVFRIINNNAEREEPRPEINGTLFSKDGIDDIEFFISLNTGESPKPLKKVASGGEISRVMLALKSALGAADDISTMVFDEIDSGVGGAISMIIGEKLHSIAIKKQIIVISHLAQIACFSKNHYFIDKYVENGRTKIKIKKLSQPEKVGEISRMLGGTRDSEISIKYALELIEKAISIKKNLNKETLKVGY